MRPPLDDLASLDHQDLVSAPNGREPVRDHERGAAPSQRAQAVLDERLALAVQARGCLVQDENRWIGEDGPRNGDALPLASGELHTPLPNDRLIPVRELLDELVGVRNARHVTDVPWRGAGPCEADVLGNRPVEQKVLL